MTSSKQHAVGLAVVGVLVAGLSTSCTQPDDSSGNSTGRSTSSSTGSSTEKSPGSVSAGPKPTAAPTAKRRTDKPSAEASDRSRAQRLSRKPAAPRTRVTRVAGRWPGDKVGPRTRRLAAQTGRPVQSWLTRGFIAPDYPTRHFGGAFRSFTPDARRDARRQPGLTTNAVLGPSVVDAVPVRRLVLVSALAPAGRAVGATADVSLVLRGLRRSGRRTDLRLDGQVFLTHVGGRWRIFGYDLQRSLRPTGRATKGDR